MNISDRDKKIVFGIVPILLLAAFWFLILAPKREDASAALAAQTKQEERRDVAKALVDSANNAKTDFSADFAQIVRLGKAIPAQVDMPSVIVQLDAAAAGTGISFTKIATGEREVTPAPATPAPATPAPEGQAGTPAAAGGESAQSVPGAATESANNAAATANQQGAAADGTDVTPVDAQTSTPSGSGLPVGGGTTAAGTPATSSAPTGLETVPLELEFVGNFFNLADFFHSVKRFVRVANQDVLISGRLITIEGVRWSSEADIFPRIRATVKATMYLSPKAQGSTAGATPGGPATTTPATAAPAESSPEPAVTPTATASP